HIHPGHRRSGAHRDLCDTGRTTSEREVRCYAMSEPVRIDVWSDVVCPWCYIGKRRLEAAIEMYRAEPDSPDVEVVFHSFQLAPDLPTDIDQSALEYLVEHKGVDESRARAMQNHVTHVAS